MLSLEMPALVIFPRPTLPAYCHCMGQILEHTSCLLDTSLGKIIVHAAPRFQGIYSTLCYWPKLSFVWRGLRVKPLSTCTSGWWRVGTRVSLPSPQSSAIQVHYGTEVTARSRDRPEISRSPAWHRVIAYAPYAFTRSARHCCTCLITQLS
jgi:hypothetical protein